MDLLLGLDVGTTAVKGLAWDASGRPQVLAAHPVSLLTQQPGWVEQDAEELWQAVVKVCHGIIRRLPARGRICAVSLSTQGGTTIPVDAKLNPTHNAFSWMDERAAAESATTSRELGDQWVYATTGWTLYTGSALNIIPWFRKNCPESFAKTSRFLFVNDFILARLSGELCMDPSNAGITQLYNLANNAWDERLLEHAGVRLDQVSPIHPSGMVTGGLTAAAASATGLPAGIPVVNGAHDQYCAALGTGVTRPGEVMLSCGTAWVVLVVPPGFSQAFQGGMCVSPHAVPGLWGGIRSLAGVGASVEWLLEQLWPDLHDPAGRYQALNQAAAASPAGARGLTFTPLSGGHLESGELANRGLLGLSLNHTRGDIARALLEGIALELNWTLQEIQQGTPVRRLKMIGGAARSPIWPQIVADLTRIPVDLPSIPEAASLGAAMLAGVGAGWFTDAASAYDHFHPDQQEILPGPDTQVCAHQLNQNYQHLWGLMPHQTETETRGTTR
jgi:sugar (pentulose or hexulose) kinase